MSSEASTSSAQPARPTVTVYPPGSTPDIARNRFSDLIPSQSIAVVSSFTLDSGVTLRDVSVGFRTWGRLNDEATNALVICHALTGSSDVEDWWGPLLGQGKSFDPTRYFIFCANVLGSPYGTASPVTKNPDTGKRWGPEFPATTSRDDVRLHRLILDHLGAKSVAAVIGGSMGGMCVLEWPLVTEEGYVRNIVPIATSARHSAWGISWGETQRQSIWSDPDYSGGWYDEKGVGPHRGLSAARMAALLTYRSRDSFESRFGRKEVDSDSETPVAKRRAKEEDPSARGLPRTAAERAEAAHNDGHTRPGNGTPKAPSKLSDSVVAAVAASDLPLKPNGEPLPPPSPPPIFSAQSYLRYQGNKFVNRFDANCYIHLSRKMDAHDVSRGREGNKSDALSHAPSGALVIAISSDGLFTLSEQEELARTLPDAKLVIVESPDGHDGFLLEFEQIDGHVLRHLKERLPEIYEGPPVYEEGANEVDGAAVKKASLFGEAEGGDIASW